MARVIRKILLLAVVLIALSLCGLFWFRNTIARNLGERLVPVADSLIAQLPLSFIRFSFADVEVGNGLGVEFRNVRGEVYFQNTSQSYLFEADQVALMLSSIRDRTVTIAIDAVTISRSLDSRRVAVVSKLVLGDSVSHFRSGQFGVSLARLLSGETADMQLALDGRLQLGDAELEIDGVSGPSGQGIRSSAGSVRSLPDPRLDDVSTQELEFFAAHPLRLGAILDIRYRAESEAKSLDGSAELLAHAIAAHGLALEFGQEFARQYGHAARASASQSFQQLDARNCELAIAERDWGDARTLVRVLQKNPEFVVRLPKEEKVWVSINPNP